MFEHLYKRLKSKRDKWANEEELRQGWIFALQQEFPESDFHAERGKKDSSYNNVVIEFKAKGAFKGKQTSPAFNEAMNERLFPYILKYSTEQNQDPSDYIGIAIDGDHICFAQVVDKQIKWGDLLEFSETSVSMVATAIKDNYRRALVAENLIDDFGHSSDCGVKIMNAFADALSSSLNDPSINKTKMLFEEWQTLFGQVADLSTEQIDDINKKLRFTVGVPKKLKIPASLFVIHTFNSLVIKLLAAEIISAHQLTRYTHFAQNLSVVKDAQLLKKLDVEIEKGKFYSSANVHGFVEEALFSWYLDACKDNKHKDDIIAALRDILVKLSFYRTDNLTQAQSKDLLKIFYQNLVPETLRKTLGEFYTPDWLVEFSLNRAGEIDWLTNRTLDPTCGSGSFLIEVIKRKIASARAARWNSKDIIDLVTQSVWGFDLNPLAVQTARVNFLIYIADLLKEEPGQPVELPVLLADAIYSPASDPNDNEEIVRYVIGSEKADLPITLPSKLASDRQRLDVVFEILGHCVEKNLPYGKAEEMLVESKALTKIEAGNWQEPIRATYDKVFGLHAKNWNGIWFRIIRNFFWSSTAGKFTLVAGNPPWVRWSKLPELYRQRVKPTCLKYNIFSSWRIRANCPHVFAANRSLLFTRN